MNIKLDENVTVAAVPLLEQAGHDVESVPGERLVGVSDSDLLRICADEHRLLITFDLGLGDVRVHPLEAHAGVLLLRLSDQQPAVVVDVLARLLAVHDLDSLEGRLTVVTERLVRIR